MTAANGKKWEKDVTSVLQMVEANSADPACWLTTADELETMGLDDEATVMRLTTQMRAYHPPSGYGTEAGTREFEEYQTELQRICDKPGFEPAMPHLINSVGMRLNLVPAGIFLMGSPEDEKDRSENEGPQHWVELTQSYYMGIYPVTQRQWTTVMGTNPSFFRPGGNGNNQILQEDGTPMDTSDFPVEYVSWHDAKEFCEKLTATDRTAGVIPGDWVYDLPTEAQWEYACRASTRTPFHYGRTLSSFQANFNGNHPYGEGVPIGPYLQRTSECGSYRPNAFGLYDMHGNVWEWCADWYDPDFYSKCLAEAEKKAAEEEAKANIAAGAPKKKTSRRRKKPS